MTTAVQAEAAISPLAKPAAVPSGGSETIRPLKTLPSLRERLEERAKSSQKFQNASVIFDLPVTYNRQVSYWIKYFQTRGRTWFHDWLEDSTKYMPYIQKELKAMNLPQDLAFMVMIESGFQTNAISHAAAVGPWQFIEPTAVRYGLKVNWWLDERRDWKKSTLGAIRYLRDLYAEFNSWYLVAASYNMGEGGLRRQINKYGSRDFWTLAHLGALPSETVDYVPKIIAAMIMAKAPGLYGFRDIAKFEPLSYDLVSVPGGTDLRQLSDVIGVTAKSLKDLNSELVLGYVPAQVPSHMIRVPKGSFQKVAQYFSNKTAQPHLSLNESNSTIK